MKKYLMLMLLVILSLSFMSSLFAQVPVTIGDGTSANTTTGPPAPYGTWYKAFRQQFLVLASELNNGGGGPGDISSVAFNVDVLNNCTPMTNFRVRMKHTDQTALTTTFEDGAYQTVFQADEFMPEIGWNTHQFSAPFVWDGASNILIETVTDVVTGAYAQNASTFYTTTNFNSSLRYQNDNNDGGTATSGTTSTNRSNMKFMMEQLDMVDMAAMSITGPEAPQVNENAIYTIRVKNLCTTTVSDYTVKLMSAPDTMIASASGIAIGPMEELDFELSWTPTEDGDYQLFGRVEKTGDENPANDNTAMYPVLVLPEGTVIIGNGTTAQRQPFGGLYGFERSVGLYTADEIGGTGSIHNVGWHLSTANVNTMPYKIYLGVTDDEVLTAQTFASISADMTLVKEGEHLFENLGWNNFTLDTPYIYTGGNLLVAVESNYGGSGGFGSINFNYTSTPTSHMYWQTDNNPPTTNGSVNANRPNLMLMLSELSGDPELAVSPANINFGDAIFGATLPTRNISLSNIGGGSLTIAASDVSLIGSSQFDYDNSVFPLVIDSAETMAIPVTFTGTIEGPATATITISYGGEDFDIELSANVLPDGLVIIGDGTANNYMPVNVWYGYSYAQMLYLADEILTEGRQIEKVAYHWNGVAAGVSSDEWTIYMGHTDKEAFDNTTDWIDINELTEVYQGTVNIPAENMWIEIMLNMPFVYNGQDNLVIAVRETHAGNDGNSAFFYNTPSTTGRSLRCQSDSVVPNPEAPPTGTLTAAHPNIRMYFGDVAENPVLGYSPESLDFGDAIFGAEVGPRNVIIMNQGGGTLDLTANDIEITGANAALFSFDDDVFPVSLETGENVFVPVYVTGTVEGPVSATLIISYGGEEHEVELSANILPDGLVIIGEGTANNYMPINAYYGYSYAQMLYMADEIMTEGRQIEKVGYHWNGAGVGANSSDWTIYMGHTDKEAFDNTTDWIDVDELTQVYQGFVDIPAENMWIEIELNLPFVYNGDDNLVIAVRETEPGYDASTRFFYNTPSTTGRSIRAQNDSTVPNPAAPPTGTLTSAHPNIRIYFGDVPDNPVISVFPDNIDFGTIFFNAESDVQNVTVMNAGGGTLQLAASAVEITGTNAALFSFDDSGFPFALETAESGIIPVSLVGSVDGEVEATLEITYGGETFTVELTAEVLPEGVVIIGDGTANQRYPFGHLWGYERSASVYPFEDIGAIGAIESIGWELVVAGTMPVPYKIYLGTIDETETTQQLYDDMIDDMTLVSEGELTFDSLGWNLFELDTPYIYTGGNLLVAVEVNYGGSGGQATERFTYTGGHTNQHIYWNADNNPPTTQGVRTALRPNLMLHMGELGGDPELAINPEAINFGDVIYGAEIGPRNITVSNIGGGSITIAAADVSFTGSTQFSYDDSVFPIVLGSAESAAIPVFITGTIEGPTTAMITIEYDGEDFEVDLSANVLPDGLVVIGNGTANNYMPVNTYYGYSYAQMLYLADEIQTQGRQLNKVAYHWNGAGAAPNTDTWTLYMGHTDKTAFANTTDWIDIDDLTLVYQGTVDMLAENMWIELELDTPFIYNGVDNLVIAARETQPGYDSSSYFFYNTPSTTGRSLRCQSDSVVPDPAAPPTGTLTAAHPNIRMYFGDIPSDPVLAVSPNVDEWDFGLKPRFSETTKAFTIANNGAGVLTVNSVTVTGDGFALEEAFVATDLASTESVVINVIYNPDEAGDYEGLLAITSTHGSRDIDLIGSCYDPVITEFPFFEGFEVGNTQGSTDIAQWEQIIGTEYPTQSWTANSTMTTYERTPRTGDWNATLRYNGESTLYRPIMLEEGEEYSMEIYARQNTTTEANAKLSVSFGTEPTVDGMNNVIIPETGLINGDYQLLSGEFIAPSTGLFYIGIYGWVNVSPWYISIDDITIYQGEIPEDLVPPSHLRASVDGMDVQLEWNAPGDDTPPAGTPQWISWCDVNTYGQNAIGTNGVVVFDVAHRYDANDLAPYQGMALTKMSFVPNQVDCIYTAKVWTGTSAAAPSTLIHSQVLPPPVMNEWNEVIFTNPIPIPATGELWFGYECDTQTGHPAGVDAGPPVAGKGNMFYFNQQWMTLDEAGATLTYNWSIQGYVDNATPPAHARVLRPIHEEPREIILGANFSEANPFAEAASRSDNRAQTGYKVYRDNDLLATINNPGTLTYLDEVTAAGTYSYTVTATYDGGESEPAGPVEVEVEAPAAPIFAITPTSHNFGEVGVGQTASQEFTVSNEGAGTLTINAITISGAMMSLDTLPTLPANLTAGQTLEFTAIYAPTAEGAHTGTITVTDNLTRVAHTVALSGTGVDVGDLYPPVNLQASVVGMDVTLTWDEPVTGDWITWCNPDEVGNAIGTGGDAVFDVAHRFDANDLSPYQGNAITKVGFVPNEANCTYTIKLWAGTSAAAPSTVIHSQVVNSPVIGDWNEVELTTPVGIPPTGELWVGYEANTQTGHPAGCDGGPPIAGKGNMMYFNNQWIQLTDAGATLTYNWLIMSYVDYEARALVHADQPAINLPVASSINTGRTRDLAELSVLSDIAISSAVPGASRARTGYNLYRDNTLVGSVDEGEDLVYVDTVTDFGTYAYTVTAVYDEGESAPEGPVEVTVADLEPPADLSYSIAQNHVTLDWNSPVPPLEGEWITWSNNDELGNSIGTGGATTFEVAHRYAVSDLTDHVGGSIASVMIVPGYEFCTYTIKVWTGGNASSPGNLMTTQVLESPQVGTWNAAILHNPVEILAGQELWIGYHVNTQGGHPAGCDNGPPVSGKGNMMNMGGWTTLDQVNDALTYNWQIQGLVVQSRDGKNIESPILVDTQTTSSSGALSLAHVSAKKDRSPVLVGYKVYRDGDLIGSINDPQITTFTQRSVPNGVYEYGVTGVYSTGESSPATIEVTVNLELEDAVLEDSFEDYPDFATAFDPWTLVDQDQAPSYGFTGIDFPGSGSPFAFMIFNPTQTVPPIDDPLAYEGDKMAASFASTAPPNNDWMITPRISLGANSAIRLFARSHTATYGLERFKVAVSVMPSPLIMGGYTYISGDDYIEAPANWTEYYFDISNYDNEQVFIAVHCMSNDAFVFYVDNFTVHSGPTSTEDEVVPVVVTELSGNYPNPFNPETTISYSLQEAGNVSIDIYNIKGQLVKHLVRDDMAAGNHTAVWNGTDNNNRAVSSGVYFYKMNSGNYSSTKKMIMMK